MLETEVTHEELRHDLDSAAIQLEIWLEKKLPKDGSADAEFEDWKEAFYRAFDHPNEPRFHAEAAESLSKLQAKL